MHKAVIGGTYQNEVKLKTSFIFILAYISFQKLHNENFLGASFGQLESALR